MVKKRTKQLAAGALIASAAGYVAGVLTAPKSGKATRKDIKKAAIAAKSQAEKKLKLAYSRLDDTLQKANKALKVAKGTTKLRLAQAVKRAQKAKKKAREALSAFHEGETDEQHLKQALSEAKKAALHLEKYIGSKAKAVKKALKK